jgi:small redox-active disulfide protein 1
MVLIKLFTSPTCPACPKAKEVLRKIVEENKDIMVLEFNVNTDEGLREALRYDVRAVPTIVINDRYVIVGIPNYKKRLFQN